MLVSVRKIKQCLSFYIVIGNSIVTVLIEKKEKKTKTSTIFPLYYCGILVIVYEKHAKVNIAVFV